MHRLKALLIKEFIQMSRDRMTFAMMVGIPLIQIILFGFAIDTNVKHMKVAVFDSSLSSESREFVSAMTASQYFDIAFVEQSVKAVDDHILSGDAKVGVIFPPDYADNLKHGRTAEVQVVLDASDNTTAGAAMSTLNTIGTLQSQAVLIKRLQPTVGKEMPQPIKLHVRPWFNPTNVSAYFMVPGIAAIVLVMTMVMVTAMAIVREKENGTLEQLLVTPLRSYELMLGKIIPYILVGYAQTILAIGAGILIFGVPFLGSPLALFVMTTLFIIASLSLGILISTVATTQNQAMQMSLFVFMPSVMLSGFIFPRESMPIFFYYLGDVLPITYFMPIIRGIVLKGIGFEYFHVYTAGLVVYTLAVFSLAIIKFKTKLG